MLKLRVNQKDLTHVFACLDKLKILVTDTLRKSIPEQSAREFATLLKSNIEGSTKYAGVFKALTRWKKTEPNAGMFWKWTGATQHAINFHRIDDSTWFAGWGTAKGGATPGRREKIASSVKKRQKKVDSPTVVKRNKFTGQLEKVQVNKPVVAKKEVTLDRAKADRAGNAKVLSQLDPAAKKAMLERYYADKAIEAKKKVDERNSAKGISLGHEPIKRHIDTQRN